jgi:hypothetical protein
MDFLKSHTTQNPTADFSIGKNCRRAFKIFTHLCVVSNSDANSNQIHVSIVLDACL